MKLILNKDYQPVLDLLETQLAIKQLKDYFERNLADKLSLLRVTAPLFVQEETGLNDNLSGKEDPVSFNTQDLEDIQIVHSLAKWKRNALERYKFAVHTGLYTDMNAIRKDEVVSNIHSIYVDQWDWEYIIKKEERNFETLENIVKTIYNVLKSTEMYICAIYPHLDRKLPEDIFFIDSQELLDMYPELNDKERELEITRLHKAVFIKRVGRILSNGIPHDDRAPDYDDWELNGDILVYNPIHDSALELSSMGIRVDKDSLVKQLDSLNLIERVNMPYHQDVLNEKLPYTIGGGIGQSRICMFFLEKMHIGEVQSSCWSKEILDKCLEHNIRLL